ncbi:MAG: phosphotransferase [Deltaproteobacteria bacterium]|nr:phosphotransferase [Deltaproteobacteria bacterium]
MTASQPTWAEALAAHGIAARTVEPLYSGVNSERFRVETADARYFVKRYRGAPEERQTRLQHEVEGLRFLHAGGVRAIVAPCAVLPEAAVVCFPFHDFAPIAAAEVRPEDCTALAACYGELPRATAAHRARIALIARDAAFTCAAHVAIVAERLQRLEAVACDPLQALLAGVLRPRLQRIGEDLSHGSAAAAWGASGELPWEQRIFSPSDAGLHNVAWDTARTELRCFDFEYCGWDDPAKLLCDCLLQPAVPLPPALAPGFVAAFAAYFSDDGQLLDRARWLYPLLAVKWAAIVLNPLLPSWATHHPPLPASDRTSRLQRARAMLQRSAMPEPEPPTA